MNYEPNPQGGTFLIPSNKREPEECDAISETLARIGDKVDGVVGGATGRRSDALQRDPPHDRQHLPAHAHAHVAWLERDGLVTRTVYPTIPPRVDYELTRLGRTLREPVIAIAEWARKNRPTIAQREGVRCWKYRKAQSIGANRVGRLRFCAILAFPVRVESDLPARIDTIHPSLKAHSLVTRASVETFDAALSFGLPRRLRWAVRPVA